MKRTRTSSFLGAGGLLEILHLATYFDNCGNNLDIGYVRDRLGI